MSKFEYYTRSSLIVGPKFYITKEDMLYIHDYVEALAGPYYHPFEDRDILLDRVTSADFIWHLLDQCPWLEDEDEIELRERTTIQLPLRVTDIEDLVREYRLYEADCALWEAKDDDEDDDDDDDDFEE